MTNINHTSKITIELDDYLKYNNYFDEEDETLINQNILLLWDSKFKSAITFDISSKFENIEIDFLISEFELISEDNQGACLFYHKLVMVDKINHESLKVNIKTLVNINKTNLYLDSSYASISKWQGESKHLKVIYDSLKTADKDFDYFNPISLEDFLK